MTKHEISVETTVVVELADIDTNALKDELEERGHTVDAVDISKYSANDLIEELKSRCYKDLAVLYIPDLIDILCIAQCPQDLLDKLDAWALEPVVSIERMERLYGVIIK